VSREFADTEDGLPQERRSPIRGEVQVARGEETDVQRSGITGLQERRPGAKKNLFPLRLCVEGVLAVAGNRGRGFAAGGRSCTLR